MSIEFYRVIGQKYVFGLRVEDGVIIETAPVARWAIGKKLEDIKRDYRARGWTIQLVPQNENLQP